MRLWSDVNTWNSGRLPQAGEEVTIPANMDVQLDIDPPALGGLVIKGNLSFAARNTHLVTAYILVQGSFNIGTEANPFTAKARITLTGSPDGNVHDMGNRALLIHDGEVNFFGSAPSVTWTQINAHAEPGTRRLILKESVNWHANDVLAIAPTDFYGIANTERLTLSSNVSGNQLMTNENLAEFHWGRLQYVTNSGMSLTPDANFTPPATPFPTVLDQRAVVANLSRNIVIEGVDDNAWKDNGFGAHIMVMGAGANSRLKMDGVEIRRAGQAGKIARYPLHWHLLSYNLAGKQLADADDQFVRNSVIWNSANRCIVLHGTNGVTVKNNICHDILGHAFFLEDAVERRNVLEGNLALKVRNPIAAHRLQTHEGSVFQGGSSGFWLTNPDNVVRNNWAADAEGNGFWMAFPRQPLGLSKKVVMKPDRVKHGIFEYNTAQSNRRPGVLLDWVPINDAGDVTPNKYIPTSDEDDDPSQVKRLRFELKRLSIWKNGQGAYVNRVSNPDYVEWVTADNVGTFFSGAGDDGWILRHLVVGTSLNNRNTSREAQVAFASYHSTFHMAQNVIVNMPFVSGQSSGAFKTDDYYITAVDKGTVRNSGNRLINSSPGYRTLAPALRSPVPPKENWTLAGALWDPYGYWGPVNNYWVYDIPFLTHGAVCEAVMPAGQNGTSCSGEYYGVGSFITDFDTRTYSFKAPIEVIRQEHNGVEIGRWTVADGDVSNKLGNMRHFAAREGGHYVLSFPGKPLAKMIEMEVTNAFRPTDHFMMAVAYDGIDNPTAYTISPFGHRSGAYVVPKGSPQRRDMSAATNLNEVQNSAGDRYWIDRTNQLIWFKYRAGLQLSRTPKPDSFDDIYRPYQVVIDGR